MPDLDHERLYYVRLPLCGGCLEGAGGECHTAGCALWISTAPDVDVKSHPAVEFCEPSDSFAALACIGIGVAVKEWRYASELLAQATAVERRDHAFDRVKAARAAMLGRGGSDV